MSVPWCRVGPARISHFVVLIQFDNLTFHATHAFGCRDHGINLEDIIVTRTDNTTYARSAQLFIRIFHPALNGLYHLFEEKLIDSTRRGEYSLNLIRISHKRIIATVLDGLT